jgi:hypothetical protein
MLRCTDTFKVTLVNLRFSKTNQQGQNSKTSISTLNWKMQVCLILLMLMIKLLNNTMETTICKLLKLKSCLLVNLN